MSVRKDLGMVTAYAYAISKGYTGTEDEFAALMADYAAVGQRAEAAATAAAASATAAEGSASDSAASASAAAGSAGTATTAAGNASQAAQNASQSASAASGSATAAGQSATAAADSATTAGNKASEAAQSATGAAASATTAGTAATNAQTAQTAAEAAQTAAETAQGAAEDAAESVEGKAAQIDQNTEDISLLKSHLEANTNAGGALDILQFETTGGNDSALYVIGGTRYYFQNVTPDGVTKASAQLYVKGDSGSAVQIPTNGNKFSYLAPSSGVLRIYCNGNAPGAVYLYMHGRTETEIESINAKIGSSNMGTTATTLTGAVAEHTQNINVTSAGIDGLINSSGAISKLNFSGTGSQDTGIFVKAGNKYTLENITPTDLTTISTQIYVPGQSASAVALGASYGAKVTYTAPADGILRVYNTASGGGNLHLYVHGYLQEEIDAIADDINAEQYNLFSIFGNFGACGDSLISGVIEGAQSGTSVTKYTLSWAAQLANICHNDYAHYSEGGLTAKAWLSTFGSSVASKDSYLVALGTNDYNDPNMPLGTNADIGTSAESFYRYYGDIVSLLKSTNPNAKIFLCSIYRGEGERVDWNAAIKYFADNNSNTYYVDFSNMTADFGAYKNGSHFSAMGYKMIAVRVSKLISDIIQNNFSEFRYVGF